MSFPATNGSTFPVTLADTWTGARAVAAQIKAQCTTLLTQIAAGPTSSQAIVNACSYLANLNVQLTTYATVPGIAAYAQQQVNNPSLDVAGAFNAMQSALVSAVTWIVTNFPKDGSNNLLCIQFNGSGQLVWSTFTTAQLSGLTTALNTLSATIA